jgi:hypothetical protein
MWEAVLKMEDKKYLVSYSPRLKDYVMICIGGQKEQIKMQQIINARGSDETISEVSEEKYGKIYDNIELKHFIRKNI